MSSHLGGVDPRPDLLSPPRVPDWLIGGRPHLIRALLAISPAEWELWNSCLTDFQRSEAMRTGYIPARGSAGNSWLIGIDMIANVAFKLRPGVEVVLPHHGPWTVRFASWEEREQERHNELESVYCLIVQYTSVIDSAVARVLLIQADEEYFASHANKIV